MPPVTSYTGVPHDGQAERALAAAVGPHQGVGFAMVHRQIDAPKNRFVTDGDVQIFDLQDVTHRGSSTLS